MFCFNVNSTLECFCEESFANDLVIDDTYGEPFASQSSQKRKAFEHHLQSNTITKRSRFDDQTPLINRTSQSINYKKRKKPDDTDAGDRVGGVNPWQPPPLTPPPSFDSFISKFPPTTTTSMDNISMNNPKRFRSDVNSRCLQTSSNFNELPVYSGGNNDDKRIGINTGNGQECPSTTLNYNQGNNNMTFRKSRFGPEMNSQYSYQYPKQSERFGQVSGHTAGQFNKNTGNIPKTTKNSSELEQFGVNNRNTGNNIETSNTSMFRNDHDHRKATGSSENQGGYIEFPKNTGNLENSYNLQGSSTLENNGTHCTVDIQRSSRNFPNSLTNAEFGKSSRPFWQPNENNSCETNINHYPNTGNSNNRNFRENIGNYLCTNDQSSDNQYGNSTTKTNGNQNNTGNFPYDYNQNNYDISSGKIYNNTGNFSYGHNQNRDTSFNKNYSMENSVNPNNTGNFSYCHNKNNKDTLGNLSQFQGNKQFPSNVNRDFQQNTGNFQNNLNRYQGYNSNLQNGTLPNESHFQQNTGFGNNNKVKYGNPEFRRGNVRNFTNNKNEDINFANCSSNNFTRFESNVFENNGNRNNSGNNLRNSCFDPQNESTSTEIMPRFGRNSTRFVNKPQLYQNNKTAENLSFHRNTGNFSNLNNANTKLQTPAQQFQENKASSENPANIGFHKNTGNFSNLNNANTKLQTLAPQFQENKARCENSANTGFHKNTGNSTQLSQMTPIEMADGNVECFQMPKDGYMGNNEGNSTQLPPNEDDGKNIQFGMKRRMGGPKGSYSQRHEMDQLFMKKAQQTNNISFATMQNQQQFVPLQSVLDINPAPPVEDLTKPPPPLNVKNAIQPTTTQNNGPNSKHFQNVRQQSGGQRFRNNQPQRGNRAAGPRHFGARQVNNRQFGVRPFRGNNNGHRGQKSQFTSLGIKPSQRKGLPIDRKSEKFPKGTINRFQSTVRQNQQTNTSSTFNNNIKKRPTFGAINPKRYGGKQPNKYAMLLKKVKTKFAKRPKNAAAKERKKKMRKLRKLTQKQHERLVQGKPEHLEHIDVNKQVFGEFVPINVGGGAVKKPAKGHLKPEPETYWQQWWSLYGYVEKSLTPIDPNDESVKASLNFLLSPTDKEFRKRKRTLLVMGVSKILRHIRLNENDYAMRDIFSVLKYKHQLEDPQFQQHLNAKEAERVEKVLKHARKKTRRALFYQSMICRWHFSTLILKRADNGEPLKCRHARKLMNDKTFNFLVGEAIKELKILITEDWPKFEEFYLRSQ